MDIILFNSSNCFENHHGFFGGQCSKFPSGNIFNLERKAGGKCTFRAVCAVAPEAKNGSEGRFLHTSGGFVQPILRFFVPFCISVSTPKNKKSRPNFSAALTFFWLLLAFSSKMKLTGCQSGTCENAQKCVFLPEKTFSCPAP